MIIQTYFLKLQMQFIFLFTAGILLFSSNAIAQPQVYLTASRTTGPAPLAVFFDATGTTHSDTHLDTYRQIGYYFDFDDQHSGVWETTGLSKNHESGGPIAAHVFDAPGQYTVGVRAQDSQGAWSDAWQIITVTDPNVEYSGTNTVALSRGMDFTGAPPGAQLIHNITSWPAFESNKRYLLKTGDDFSALGQIFLRDVSDFQISTFGSGAQPIVSTVFITMHENNAATPPQHGVVENLQTLSIRQQKMFHHLLVYKNTLIGNGAGISNAGALDWYPLNQPGTSAFSDWQRCRGIFIVENYIDMNNAYIGPRNGIQGGAKWFSVLGNRSTNANEHTLRAFYSYKSVFGHNELTGMNNTGGRHALKMHAIGVDDWQDSLFPAGDSTLHHPRSRYIRVHNNILGHANSLNAWTFQLAPQDDGSSQTVEGLQDVIVEGNQFITSGATQADMQTLGSRITERGSVRNIEVWTTTFPSNYPNDASWHGPYYINDVIPVVSTPSKTPTTSGNPSNNSGNSGGSMGITFLLISLSLAILGCIKRQGIRGLIVYFTGK